MYRFGFVQRFLYNRLPPSNSRHSMALRKESQRQEYDRRQRAENRKKVVDLWQYIEKQTKKMGKPAKVLSCKLFEVSTQWFM